MDKAQLEKLLASVTRSNAASLHLVAGHHPCMRLQGKLVRSANEPFTDHALETLGREFLFEDHRQKLAMGEDVEFLYSSQEGARFRTMIMRQAGGLSMTFHRIPTTIPSIKELKLPLLMSSFTELRSGMVVITGFMGSGKSTTLAALVDQMNRETARHVVMIEDPIEFIHMPLESLVHQREVGFHVGSYAEGIRDACRHGADVIVAGQVTDHETLEAILDATEKGVLVFTTLRSSGVAAALTEMLSFCPPEERARMRTRLTPSLRVIVAQTLVKSLHNKGRLPLVEILINNQTIGRIIRTGKFKDLPQAMLRCRGLGMQTVDMALRELLLKNLISEEEALYHANDRDMVISARTVRI